MALNFLRPGAPRDQPLAMVDLSTAVTAITVAVLNAGVTSLSYHLLSCHGGDGGAKTIYAYYDLYFQDANLATAMLGVALLVVGMAFPEAVFRSPAWHPVVKWMVWVTKVLTGVTLTYSLSVLHSCVWMYAWPFFHWLSHGFYQHFFLVGIVILLGNVLYFYSVYCSGLRRVNIE